MKLTTYRIEAQSHTEDKPECASKALKGLSVNDEGVDGGVNKVVNEKVDERVDAGVDIGVDEGFDEELPSISQRILPDINTEVARVDKSADKGADGD